jgi:hypothetical protein
MLLVEAARDDPAHPRDILYAWIFLAVDSELAGPETAAPTLLIESYGGLHFPSVIAEPHIDNTDLYVTR